MSEQTYRGLADQMQAARAAATDDDVAAAADRAGSQYATAGRLLKSADQREVEARNARQLSTLHFRQGRRTVADHFALLAEENMTAAAHLRALADTTAGGAEADHSLVLEAQRKAASPQQQEDKAQPSRRASDRGAAARSTGEQGSTGSEPASEE